MSAGYEVPTYKVKPGSAYFHFLHGNVPGHQIDYIYRPDVPQDPLTRQHFSHLARLLKYIEPRHGSAYAFAICNLSRDDTQYEPGHGGVAFVFGLRIKGAKDHAGRQDPPFCHAAALIDRNMDGPAVYEAAVDFYNRLLPDAESQAEGSDWYHNYVQHAQNPDALLPLLKMYLEGFEDLPQPGPSNLTFRWTVENSNPPKRVVIVYPDRVDFPTLAYCMARIANVLVESDVKWTAISNGRESDIQGGLTVRFVPRREAVVEPPDVVLMYLEQVPEDPAQLAAQLFDAHEVRISQLPDFRRDIANPMLARSNARGPSDEARRRPWEQPLPDAPMPVQTPHSQPPPALPSVPPVPIAPTAPLQEAEDPTTRTAGLAGLVQVVERKEPELGVVLPPQPTLAAELKKKQQKQQFSTLIGVAVLVVAVGVIAAVWFGSTPTPAGEGMDATSATVPIATTPPTPKTAATPSGAPTGPTLEDHPLVIEPGAPLGTGTKPVPTGKKPGSGASHSSSTSTPKPSATPTGTRPRGRIF